VLVSSVLSLFFARQLARPLDQLARAARRIADGDYAAAVPRAGPEELTSLADSFNQMALSLREQERTRRELIANIAHELRTPLTNLEGYLEAMRDGVIVATPEQLASLHEEVERLVRLSRSLDTLSDEQLDGGQTEINLAQALRSAVEVARPGFEAKGIDVRVRMPHRLHARAHPDHLAQVLANLLQNAARYTPAGGRVTVAAETRRSDVLVMIANTGDGIPDRDLPHVFERFYRVEKSRDAARGGAGIGLAIVKQLIEAAGGEVGADSSDGHTRFWFRLPA
jgi:signal transduction histidine kinase